MKELEQNLVINQYKNHHLIDLDYQENYQIIQDHHQKKIQTDIS